jgi:hypothetical protein
MRIKEVENKCNGRPPSSTEQKPLLLTKKVGGFGCLD